MTHLLYCLADQLPIKLVVQIDQEIPIDKIHREKLKRAEVRQQSPDKTIIGLRDGPEKTLTCHRTQMITNSIIAIISIVISYYMIYGLFQSVNQALSGTIAFVLIIILSLIAANYLMTNDIPVQELETMGRKMVIGSLEVDIPRNAWLEQKTIFIQEKKYLDSCIVWGGNTVFLPFFKDVEQSAILNHEVSKILDLAIVHIS